MPTDTSTHTLSLDDALTVLRGFVDEAGGQSAFGRRVGLSPSYVSSALTRRRTLGPALAAAVGLEEIEPRYRVVRVAA